MTEEFQKRLFTAFERERSSTVSGIQGTGLGLAISKSIVELMGGTIEVVTAPGMGTEFIIRVSFPITGPVESEKQEEAPEQEEVSFEGRRLLLAEDNDINREIAVMNLTALGFAVDTAANGRLALEAMLAAPAGTYDLILMDIQMPEMDGYEVTQAIRSLKEPEKAGIPIIAMTANAFDEDRKRALESGMNDHVAKPIDPQRLIEALHTALAGTRES